MLTSESLTTLKGRIHYVLSNHPKTRNSDLELQAEIAYQFYPALEHPIYNWRDIVITMSHVPSLDHVARIRRMVVSKHPHLMPTSMNVAKARKISEEMWRKHAQQDKQPSGAANIPKEYQLADAKDEL